MFDRAAGVLRRNDMGGWTRAAPNLYPHQWSWDSAFIAIGLAHLDASRAAQELSILFGGQWANGKVPHIVFNPDAPPGSYLLGPEHWAPATSYPDVPVPANTSALCQPAVHAVAALHVWEVAEKGGGGAADKARALIKNLYPKLLSWHRYLLTERDPEGSGLVTIYHPWESGTDNSRAGIRPLSRSRSGSCRLTSGTTCGSWTRHPSGRRRRSTTATSGSSSF